jgi:acetoin utilization deacetylase AcuC-like enzyme
LCRIHSLGYAEAVRKICESGGAQLNADTIVSRQSYDVARLASGAVCDAAKRVVAGEDSQALCLVRPPGHHALRQESMGFCLFNNIAIAARMAIDELDLDRVLIVDWDVHHGNGTQDSFWEDPRVGFFSIHRWPFYPGTGTAIETGTGGGLGTTRNVPIEMGTTRKDYHAIFTRELQQFAQQIKPQLILLSAGFDAHREDPVGSLGRTFHSASGGYRCFVREMWVIGR